MQTDFVKRAVCGAALALSFAFITAALSDADSQALAQTTTPQAATGLPDERLTEQAYKNIQVLKGLPESQLRPIMNLVASSLGVRCDFCHVRAGNEWQWEKDDKKHKQDARKMMQMTIDINKNSFNGQPQVTCYTCHLGKDHPTAIPPFASGPPPAAPPRANEAWPTPQQVIDKYIAAVGGKDAVAKISGRVLKGTHVLSNGNSIPFEIKFAAPDKLALVLTPPNQGSIAQGMNGGTGWLKNPREQRSLNKVEMERFKTLAWSLTPLQLTAPPQRMLFTGKDKIGDRDVYVYRVPTPDRKRALFSFDVETGLLLRRVIFTETPVGSDPEQTDYEDYREVEGVKVPFTIRTTYIDNFFSATRKFTEVQHSAKLNDADFAPPAK